MAMRPGDYERIVLDRFRYRGFHGNEAWCALEILPLADGRTVVIATETADNPGTSVTNVAEHLASEVCDRFGIDPATLVWIEYYGYPSAVHPKEPRTYEQVTFTRRPRDDVRWSDAVNRHHPDGWPGYFVEPEWREMGDDDWRALGLPPRRP